MIKIVALIKRRPGMTAEDFPYVLRASARPLFQASLPDDIARAITHYVQNHAVGLGTGTNEAAYDCVTEIGFDDRAGMRLWSDWYLGDGGKFVRDDEEHFMDPRQRVVIVTDVCDIGVLG